MMKLAHTQYGVNIQPIVRQHGFNVTLAVLK